MKFIVIICNVCVILASLQGCALGSESTESGASAEDDRACPSESATKDNHSKFNDIAEDCLTSYDGIRLLKNATSLEEFSQFFKDYCGSSPAMKNCLSSVLSMSKRCSNHTVHQRNTIHIEMLQTSLTIGCANEGEPLAKIFDGFKTTSGPAHPFVQCEELMDIAFSKAKKEVESDLSAITLLNYRILDGLKECLFERIQDEELRNTIGSFADDLRRNQKCIHPELQSLVRCSTIDNS